jgi:hypothetical protein
VVEVEVVNQPLEVTGAVEVADQPVEVTGAVEVSNLPSPSAPARFQLVGFTSATFTGGTGVLGFTLACQAEFPASRMCTSVEVMETIQLPLEMPVASAWLRPVFQGTSSPLDASGIAGTAIDLSCNSWRATNGSGLSVNSAGQIEFAGCVNPYQIACCALVP